jgi:hypothetical protein
MLHGKHFSLNEANMLLISLKPLVSSMLELKKQLDTQGYDIYRHEYFGGVGPNGTGEFPKEMEELVEIVKKIASEGVQIKSIDNGLLDFPFIRRNGEEVYLCWKEGEAEIMFWHRIPEGFTGRRNIDEL